MPDKRTLDLIHRKLDGLASQNEQDELAELLARDPGVRKVHDDMVSLAGFLGRMTQEDPPRSLKPAVMRGVEDLEARRSRSRVSLPIHRFPILSILSRPLATFWIGMVAGLLVFGVAEIVTPGSIIEGGRGTLAPPEAAMGDDLTLTAGSAECFLVLRNESDVPTLSVRLSGPEKSSIEIRWNSDWLRAEGVRHISGTHGEMEVHKENVRIAAGGMGSYEVRFGGQVESVVPLHIVVADPGRAERSGQLQIRPRSTR
jgi:hypothetical protein